MPEGCIVEGMARAVEHHHQTITCDRLKGDLQKIEGDPGAEDAGKVALLVNL